MREGSLDAPTRHPIDWEDPKFYDVEDLNVELERVFDICHGCRRCVSLCNSFPTLFDLVDESETMEVDGVAKDDYIKVVDQCYLCDLCFLTKCPYVPPHEWNVDFPHLMLRAKAIKFKQQGASKRDNMLSNTDKNGKFFGIPIVAQAVNAVNKNSLARKGMQKVLGVSSSAYLPEYQSKSAKKQFAKHQTSVSTPKAIGSTTGKVAIYATCYGNHNEPGLVGDLIKIFEHNNIATKLITQDKCCSMPKLELGDLESVAANKNHNIPIMQEAIDDDWDIIAPIPSCVLMFKQELPLMFPEDEALKKVQQSIFDPFEYLALRHKEDLLNTEFKTTLGKVSYHAPCHLRVQKIGNKTRDILNLVPDTEIELIERCAGHDGTYAVKEEFHEISMKIARPVVNKIKKNEPNYFSSDCPLAGYHLANGVDNNKSSPTHPITLLKTAYGL
ncbi:MAG: Fe-S oxidoreductase [Gammaproteobacteria bacterium]|nr:Fe-S oxidoreductase [Gammaproteobacteria bacterium]